MPARAADTAGHTADEHREDACAGDRHAEVDLQIAVDRQSRGLERVGEMHARAEIADESADATRNDEGDDRNEQPVDRARAARHTPGCVTTPQICKELPQDE